MLPRLTLILLVVAAPVALFAQEQSAKPRLAQSNVSGCNEELFERAERSFEIGWRGSELLGRAERELSEVLRFCGDAPIRYQVEEQLKLVHEELSESNLNIALFYLKRFHDGKGGKLGAFWRLKNILERYPTYSRLDQVLTLLGELNVADNNLDEAAAYYQRIIKDFPASRYVGEASLHLCEIDAMRRGGMPVPQH